MNKLGTLRGPSGLLRKQDAKPVTGGPSQIFRIPKTAEVVANHIRNMIVRGQLRDGDFLQPEAQLMAQFGTSRPTIREAFRILESEQFISVVRGSRSGARVHHPSVASVARLAGFALQGQGATLGDIYEVRLAIEPLAVRMAAEAKDEAGIKLVRDELERLRSLLDEGDHSVFRASVAHIHLSIVRLSGSPTLSLVFSMLEGILEAHQSRYVEPPDERTPAEKRKFTLWGLRSIAKAIDLIEAGEPRAAESHWRLHLENANKTWLRGYDPNSVIDVLIGN